MIKPLLLSAAAATLALATEPTAAQQSLASPDSDFVAKDNPGNWQTTIKRTERGHLIGNPEADAQLIEFVSYTCGHCASFTANGEPVLELAALAPGKMGLEVRPVIRNALDLTVSLLAQCGDPAGFKDRHRTLMLSQGEWLGKVRNAPQTQQAIWARGDKASRMNAASALGLTQMLVEGGGSVATLDACVMDDAAAQKLIDNGRADNTEFGIPGTPSFALDGKLLTNVHSWDALYPVLSARFMPESQSTSGLGG
jgi:protein-disulfide isomerase